MIFEGDRHQLGEYLRDLANKMGLRDWEIRLMDGTPDDPEHAACVDVRYGRKVASIWFDAAWAESDPAFLRSTCVHELLHAHLKPTEWALNNAADGLGVAAFTILHGAYIDALESGVDAIAVEWAKSLPLPVKAKQGKKAKAA